MTLGCTNVTRGRKTLLITTIKHFVIAVDMRSQFIANLNSYGNPSFASSYRPNILARNDLQVQIWNSRWSSSAMHCQSCLGGYRWSLGLSLNQKRHEKEIHYFNKALTHICALDFTHLGWTEYLKTSREFLTLEVRTQNTNNLIKIEKNRYADEVHVISPREVRRYNNKKTDTYLL